MTRSSTCKSLRVPRPSCSRAFSCKTPFGLLSSWREMRMRQDVSFGTHPCLLEPIVSFDHPVKLHPSTLLLRKLRSEHLLSAAQRTPLPSRPQPRRPLPHGMQGIAPLSASQRRWDARTVQARCRSDTGMIQARCRDCAGAMQSDAETMMHSEVECLMATRSAVLCCAVQCSKVQ